MEAKKEYEKEEELIKSRIAPEERVEITEDVDSITEAKIPWYELDKEDIPLSVENTLLMR